MTSIDFVPCDGNPRNSEGAFLPLESGELLFAYSAFLGASARDFTQANICLRRSQDGGNTWSEPVPIVRATDSGAMNVMSVSLLRMENGDIGLIHLVRNSWQDMRIVLRRSADGGFSWGTPIQCSTRPGYFVINNDRVLRLASGRILIPAAQHENTVDSEGKVHFVPAVSTFFYSDDDGSTWQEARTQLALGAYSPAGLQEPGVIEKAPGHLYGWARTDLGRQYEFTSEDNGETWSQPIPSRFTSPLSPLSMKRLVDGRLMAIWNPVPLDNITVEDKSTGNRTPLVYALSADQGATWGAPTVIEDDPHSGYCYTAMLPRERDVLLAYCAGSRADMGSCLNRLRIRSLPITAGEAGQDVPNRMGIGF